MDNLYDSEKDILLPEEDCLVGRDMVNNDTKHTYSKEAGNDSSVDIHENVSIQENHEHLVCGEYGNMFYQNDDVNRNEASYDDTTKNGYLPNTYTIPDSKNNLANTKHGKKKPEKNSDTIIIFAALFVAWLILPFFVSFIGLNGNNNVKQAETVLNDKESFKIQESENIPGQVYSTVGIAEKCSPSVVAITTLSKNEVITFFGAYEQESEGAGSGVIIGETDNEVLIVTNYHVIQEVDTLTVCLNDDTAHPYSATVKGSRKDYDIAVISVKKDDIDSNNDVVPAIIGNSDNAKIGEQVVAIGNALGLGQSVTVGVVSAKDRQVSSDVASIHAIQTDAAINPGNSGGALFNMHGELIGINNAKYADASVEGMGFAIPISDIKDIIEELASQNTKEPIEEDRRGYLGISAANLKKEYLQYFNAPSGAFVVDIEENGAAWDAGIRKSDIIIEVENTEISSTEELVNTVTSYEAGKEIKVKYARMENGKFKKYTVKVTLQKKTKNDTEIEEDDDTGSSTFDIFPQMPENEMPGKNMPGVA